MNISEKELDVLRVVEARTPVQAKEVAAKLGRTVSSVSASLKGLLDYGFVERIQVGPKLVHFALMPLGDKLLNPPEPAKIKGAPLTTGERYQRHPARPTGPQQRRYTHKLNKLNRRMREEEANA